MKEPNKTPLTAHQNSYLLLEMVNHFPWKEGRLNTVAKKALSEINECLVAITQLEAFRKTASRHKFKVEKPIKDDFIFVREALKHASTKQKAVDIFSDWINHQVQKSTFTVLRKNGWHPIITPENLTYIHAGYLCLDLTTKSIDRLKRCELCKHFFWDSSMNRLKKICSPLEEDGKSGCLCGTKCFDIRNKETVRNFRRGK